MKPADHDKKSGSIDGAGQINQIKMPSGRDIPFLISGIIGIGSSGPIIAKSLMPVPTLIFWRNLLGSLIMAPFAIYRQEWKTKAQRVAIRWSILAGVLLGFHFIGFFQAMRLTSVASGTAITALQPIFTALFVRSTGGFISKKSWLGMWIAFLSVLLITGIDLSISFETFKGDIYALVGAALAALYMMVGAKVQRDISTSTFTTVCYFFCAITVLAIALITKSPLSGFAKGEWLLLALLILGAQIMGHTMFNLSLKRVSPAVVSLVVFFEVPVSAILALLWLNQTPPAAIIPGLFGLIFGCTIFVLNSQQT
jgi:drug/metabolite transporter (DMT)-like permease